MAEDIVAKIVAKDEASATIKKIANNSATLEKSFKSLGKTIAGAFAVKKILDFANASIAAADAQDKMIRAIGSTEKAMGRYAANTPWKSITKDITQQLDAMKEIGQEFAILDGDIEKARLKLAGPLRGLGNDKLNEAIPKILALGDLQNFNTDDVIREIIAKASGRKLTAKNAPFLMNQGFGSVDQVNKMSLEVMVNKLLAKADEQNEEIKKAANSIGGLTKKIQNLWGRLQETAGYALMPIVKELLEKLVSLKWEKIGEGFSKIAEFAGKIFNFAVDNPALTGTTVAGAAVAGSALTGIIAANPMAALGATVLAVALVGISSTILNAIKKGGAGNIRNTPNEWLQNINKTGNLAGMDAKESMKFATLLSQYKVMPPFKGSLLDLGASGFVERASNKNTLNNIESELEKIIYRKESGPLKLNFLDINSPYDLIEMGLKGNALRKYSKEKAKELAKELERGYLANLENLLGWNLSIKGKTMPADYITGDSDRQEELRRNELLALFGDDGGNKEPIKVEISLKADMPYQASLSLTDSMGTQEAKIASKVNNRRIGLRS